MVKTKELVQPMRTLTLGGIGTTFGAHMVESMPSTGATASLAGGFTKFAGFYPMMATGASMGIVTRQLRGIQKKTKKIM